jgi:hypothetical protein
LFEIYQQKIIECEQEMAKYLRKLPHKTEDEPPRLDGREKPRRVSFNVREHAYKLLGVDLFRIKGLNSETVLRLISEVGVDVSRFPTEKHFVSWLSLSPGKHLRMLGDLTGAFRQMEENPANLATERERAFDHAVKHYWVAQKREGRALRLAEAKAEYEAVIAQADEEIDELERLLALEGVPEE